jgi:hypothetical protein
MAAMKIPVLIGCVSLLALGACGEDGSSSSSSDRQSPRDRALEGALRFARCMRENGVDVPDPQAGGNGLVRIGPGPGSGGGGPNPDDPAFRAAEGKCGKHLEAGGEARRSMPPEHRDAFVAYARCMRGEGVDMPDPDPKGGLVFRAGDPGAPNPDSATFRRAHEACRAHLAKVEADLGREAP